MMIRVEEGLNAPHPALGEYKTTGGGRIRTTDLRSESSIHIWQSK